MKEGYILKETVPYYRDTFRFIFCKKSAGSIVEKKNQR